MTRDSLLPPLLDACELGIIVVDRQRRVEVWNRWVAEHCDVPAALAYGKRLRDVFTGGVPDWLEQAIQQCLDDGAGSIPSPAVQRAPLPLYAGAGQRRQGARLEHSVAVKPLRAANGRRYCLLQIADVSRNSGREWELRSQAAELADLVKQSENAERRVRAMEEMVHRGKELAEVALQSIRDGVITTDDRGAITYMNNVATELTGLSLELGEGRPLLDVFRFEAAEISALAHERLKECLADRHTGPLAEDALVLCPDGSHIVLENRIDPLRGKNGGIVGSVLVFRDNTLQHTMVERLSYHAAHDELTGLLNRREFDRRLDEAIKSAREQTDVHALCYMDLDQFKIVNDTCGHTAGDELLRRIGQLLRNTVRGHDVLARLGGDEFGLLLVNCNLEAARRVIQKLREAVESFRFLWEGETFSVGVSVGLVEIKGGAQTRSAVMSAADTACYAAKEHGRNRICEYAADDAEFAHRQGEMQWVSRIREALEEHRLKLFCQAIAPVDRPTAVYSHYEILLRMVDRQGELIPPMVFIPAAERYHMMTALDRWVVGTCLAALDENPGFSKALDMISINISGQSLGDERFLAFVEEQLAGRKVAAEKICFEITETAAIAKLTAANEFIDRLRTRGCKFALDDFGSGLSSFAYLKRLPVDFLKIDGVFVKDMERDPIDAAMVESINRIGQVVGIETIAEFVENERILAMLRTIGVDFVQGWGIAKPEPMDRLLERFALQLKTA